MAMATLLTSRVNEDYPCLAPDRENAAKLCPELWREIISHATAVSTPFQLGTQSHSPDFEELDANIQLKLHKQSLKQKKTLALVSHTWRHLTEEFLYSVVWITSSRQALKLRNALNRKRAAGQKEPQWWIRQLLVQPLPEDAKLVLDEVKLIMSQVTRLQTYRHLGSLWDTVMPYYCDPREMILDALGVKSTTDSYFTEDQKESATVRHIQLVDTIDYPLLPFIAENLDLWPALARLESLTIQAYDISARPASKDVFIGIQLPFLIKLSVLGRSLHEFIDWELPSLQHLRVAFDSRKTALSLDDFLSKHGFCLKELELSRTYTHHVAENLALAQRCPNLSSLYMSVTSLLSFSPAFFSHPTVKRLGLWDMESPLNRGYSGELASQLESVAQELPSLETIQDLSYPSHLLRARASQLPHSLSSATSRALWTPLGEQCSTGGISLEDWTGNKVIYT